MRARSPIPDRTASAERRRRIPHASVPCQRWRHPPSLDDPTIPFDIIRREHSPPARRAR
ncbi:MAG TPA: hypothetical protein VGR57_12635 [Ktedonobacterales bacterium]|nr:hypothetical protein [Ktedonobacterales bacterium]